MPIVTVEGQYFLSITNVTFTTEQFKSIRIFEYSGLRLPQAELVFTTGDPEQRAFLYTGKIITIAIAAQHEDSNNPIDFRVVDTKSAPSGDDLHIITVTLEQSMPEFTETAKTMAATGTSASAIIASIPSRISIDNKASGFDDTQTWIRPFQVARDFIENVWLSSYIVDSTLLLAFTIDSDLRIRDTKSIRQRGNSYDFRVLTAIEDSAKDIAASGRVEEKSASGVLSYIAASGRQRDYYDMGTGNTTRSRATPTLNFLSDRPTPEISSPNLNALPPVRLDNMHSNTAQAMLDNKANLARLSTVSMNVRTTGRYIPIHPLDLVMVLEPKAAEAPFIEAGSGLYIATTIIREISDDLKLSTTIVLNRESRNGGV